MSAIPFKLLTQKAFRDRNGPNGAPSQRDSVPRLQNQVRREWKT